MKFFRPARIGLSMIIPLFAMFSCEKLPETSFTYLPIENPEAGESIQFENTTAEANSFAWDFGDGENSTQEHPAHIFDEAGSYEVKLTATNDDGSQPKVETLTINEPTILAFYILDSTEENVINDAEVWLYDNQNDWENGEDPILTGYSDANGEVVFSNMEAIIYYIYVFKAEVGGFWGIGGSTGVIAQNEINAYSVPCAWYEDEVTKAAVQNPEPLKLIRR